MLISYEEKFLIGRDRHLDRGMIGLNRWHDGRGIAGDRLFHVDYLHPAGRARARRLNCSDQIPPIFGHRQTVSTSANRDVLHYFRERLFCRITAIEFAGWPNDTKTYFPSGDVIAANGGPANAICC